MDTVKIGQVMGIVPWGLIGLAVSLKVAVVGLAVQLVGGLVCWISLR